VLGSGTLKLKLKMVKVVLFFMVSYLRHWFSKTCLFMVNKIN